MFLILFILDYVEDNFKEDTKDYFLGSEEIIGDGSLGIHLEQGVIVFIKAIGLNRKDFV